VDGHGFGTDLEQHANLPGRRFRAHCEYLDPGLAGRLLQALQQPEVDRGHSAGRLLADEGAAPMAALHQAACLEIRQSTSHRHA